MILLYSRPYDGASPLRTGPMPLTYAEQSAKPLLETAAEWALFKLIEFVLELFIELLFSGVSTGGFSPGNLERGSCAVRSA